MYGLAVMLTIPRRTTSKNIEKILFNMCFIHMFYSCKHTKSQAVITNHFKQIKFDATYKTKQKSIFKLLSKTLVFICNLIY